MTKEKLIAMYIKLCDMVWNSKEYQELSYKYEQAQKEYYGFIPCAIGPVKTKENAY